MKDAKGKGKATGPACEEIPGMPQLIIYSLEPNSFVQDDRLWADKYEPRSVGDLAVHKRKVDDVRRWLVEAFSEQGYPERRVRSPFYSPYLKLANLKISTASAHTYWSSRFWQDGNFTRARTRNELRNNGTQDSCEYNPGIGFHERAIIV